MSDDFQTYLENGGQDTTPQPASSSDPFQSYLESGGNVPTQNAPTITSDPSLWDKYKSYMETEAHVVTGGIGSLAGGLGYLGSLALTQDPEKAAQAQQTISNAMTYEPRTALGQKWTAQVGNDVSYLGQKGGDIAGQYVAEKTGSPALGAAANVAMNVPQFLVGSEAGKEVGGAEPLEATGLLKKAQDAGLVVPPATSNPTLFNRLSEAVPGKLSTAQHASIKNQPVINSLVRKDLGMPEDAPLTMDNLSAVRQSAAPAYQAVASLPEIKFGPEYNTELDKLSETSGKLSSTLPKYKALGADQINSLVDSSEA